MSKMVKRCELRLRKAYEVVNDAKSDNWEGKIKAWAIITPLIAIVCFAIVFFLEHIVFPMLGWQ